MAKMNKDTFESGSRRNFLKNLVILAPTSLLAYRALAAGTTATGTSTSTGASAAAQGLVAESDPTAKALGYVHDPSKTDRPKKGDTEGKDQKCLNCQFYVAGNPVDGKPAGKCLMIPAGPVSAEGWCKSWMKKA